MLNSRAGKMLTCGNHNVNGGNYISRQFEHRNEQFLRSVIGLIEAKITFHVSRCGNLFCIIYLQESQAICFDMSFALKRLKVVTTTKGDNGSNEFIRFND